MLINGTIMESAIYPGEYQDLKFKDLEEAEIDWINLGEVNLVREAADSEGRD